MSSSSNLPAADGSGSVSQAPSPTAIVGREPGLKDAYAEVNGIRLHYVEQGEGPLVVLLHGFPEFWYSWSKQIDALANAGFRVVAPDMRGYNLSDKPPGVKAYDTDPLAADIAGLIRERGEERAFLAGHDWGATVAWAMAMDHPEVVERLAILNGAHPRKLQKALHSKPRQLIRSWYFFAFQTPWLPERIETLDRHRSLRNRFKDAKPGAFTKEDIDRYVDAWSQPGALTGQLNYYRAAVRVSSKVAEARIKPLQAPTRVIWGEKDRYLGRDLAEPDPADVPNLEQVIRLPDASHWVLQDEPGRVSELLREFFTRS
jgi:pimeloyl-ACP methyl ester carboxylesterase